MSMRIEQILRFLSKAYWLLFLVFIPFIFLFSTLYVCLVVLPHYSIAFFNVTSEFLHNKNNQDFLNQINSIYLHIGFLSFVFSIFLNSKIFKYLASIFSKNEYLSFEDRKQLVYKTIKYIILTYFLVIISDLSLYYIYPSNSVESLFYLLLSYILPFFGSSLDLLFCVFLYYYIKNQEQLEILKNESELVI